MIASPIGTIIIEVAVLEIHIDKAPVATINPKMIFSVLVPIKEIIHNAIRLCKFQRCIARAMINPPINRKIVSEPYEEAVVSISSPPVRGNNMIGNKDVAGIGIASVIHQVAIQRVEAKIATPS